VSMHAICDQFGISRQAHYQMLQREIQRQTKAEIILEIVRQVRRKHPKMGGRKLLYKIQPMLAEEGLAIGRDRLFDLLRAADMLVKPKKGYRRTTFPGLRRAPNLLPGLTISLPNQVWVCDITYPRAGKGRICISVLGDGSILSLPARLACVFLFVSRRGFVKFEDGFEAFTRKWSSAYSSQ
jgi:putative transposase